MFAVNVGAPLRGVFMINGRYEHNKAQGSGAKTSTFEIDDTVFIFEVDGRKKKINRHKFRKVHIKYEKKISKQNVRQMAIAHTFLKALTDVFHHFSQHFQHLRFT